MGVESADAALDDVGIAEAASGPAAITSMMEAWREAHGAGEEEDDEERPGKSLPLASDSPAVKSLNDFGDSQSGSGTTNSPRISGAAFSSGQDLTRLIPGLGFHNKGSTSAPGSGTGSRANTPQPEVAYPLDGHHNATLHADVNSNSSHHTGLESPRNNQSPLRDASFAAAAKLQHQLQQQAIQSQQNAAAATAMQHAQHQAHVQIQSPAASQSQTHAAVTGPAQSPVHGPSPLGRYYLSATDPQHISKRPGGSISFPGPSQHPVIPNLSLMRNPSANQPSPTLSMASDETLPGMESASAIGGKSQSGIGRGNALFPSLPGGSSTPSRRAYNLPHQVPLPPSPVISAMAPSTHSSSPTIVSPSHQSSPISTPHSSLLAAGTAASPQQSSPKPMLVSSMPPAAPAGATDYPSALERLPRRQDTADSFTSSMSTSSEEEDITSPMILPETSLRRGDHGFGSPGTPVMRFSTSPASGNGGAALFPQLSSVQQQVSNAKPFPFPGGQAQFTYIPTGTAPMFPPMSSSSSESEDSDGNQPTRPQIRGDGNHGAAQDSDYYTADGQGYSGEKRPGSITVGGSGYAGYDPDHYKPPAPVRGRGRGNDESDDEDEDDRKRDRKNGAGAGGSGTPKKTKKKEKSPKEEEDVSDEEEFVEDGVTKKRKLTSEEKEARKKRKKSQPAEDGDVICDYQDPFPVSTVDLPRLSTLECPFLLTSCDRPPFWRTQPYTACASRFHRTYDLARHRETIHARNEGRAVAAGTLPEHLATVWLEYGKPQCAWPCEYPGCDQVFSRKDAMQRHMKTRKHDTLLGTESSEQPMTPTSSSGGPGSLKFGL